MKTLLKILFFAAIAVSGVLALSSARKTQAKPQQQPVMQSSTYYYYPKVNMYYDLTNSVYLYRDKDGKWQSAKQVSDKVTTGMGKKAVLINPALPVWKSNDYHRMVYSTALYANANDFRKTTPKTQATAVNKSAEEKKTEEAKDSKKETGIEKFFKRLFKKKSEEKDKKA